GLGPSNYFLGAGFLAVGFLGAGLGTADAVGGAAGGAGGTAAARRVLAARRARTEKTMTAAMRAISRSQGSSTPKTTSAQEKNATSALQPDSSPSRKVLGESSTKTTGSVVRES